MKDDWKPILACGEYTIWQHTGSNHYQITNGEKPTNNAGYGTLDGLLKLKGISITMAKMVTPTFVEAAKRHRDDLNDGGDLRDYATVAAIDVLLESWEPASRDGYTPEALLQDVEDVVQRFANFTRYIKKELGL